MDKQKKHNAVFVVLGGKKKQEEETLVVQDWKIAREETAAAAEPERQEDEFEWLLPDESSRLEGDARVLYQPEEYHGKKAKSSSALGRVMLIVIGAVLIGLILGYGMLQVVTQKGEPEPQAALQEGEKPAAAPPAAGEAPDQAPDQAAVLPVLNTAIIQGGVFSTKESAETVEKAMGHLGVPTALIEENGQFILVLGISQTVESAKGLSEVYKGQGADVYAKTIEWPAPSGSFSEEAVKQAGAMAAVVPGLAEESAKAAAGIPQDGKLAEIEKELKAIQSEDKRLAALHKQLTSALEQTKSGQPANGVAAQKTLLEFVMDYQKLK